MTAPCDHHQTHITGSLKKWWADETKTRFDAKTQCIIDQYGNYIADQVGLNVNGRATQGENIADAGGIQEAYLAYGEKIV